MAQMQQEIRPSQITSPELRCFYVMNEVSAVGTFRVSPAIQVLRSVIAPGGIVSIVSITPNRQTPIDWESFPLPQRQCVRCRHPPGILSSESATDRFSSVSIEVVRPHESGQPSA